MTPKRRSRTIDLRDQVGQLLILGFDGVEADDTLRALLSELRPGGVILFARNIVDPRQTHALLAECQKAVAIPLFRCVDLEGGTVDRLKSVVAPAPAVADVAATGRRTLFQRHGSLIGQELRALGFNTDFAPVLDLGLQVSRPVLGPRTASAEPKKVVAYARGFLRGLKEARVLGCGKHFPGLGEANLDTHHELPSVLKPWRRLWDEDLYPYRALARQLPFVMVAHADYPGLTKERVPASLSTRWIEEILRGRMRYRGLVISDDLEMGGVQAAGPIEQVAVETIRAGADVFLVCHKEEMVRRAFTAVLVEAVRNPEFRARVEESAARVLAAKKKWREMKTAAAPPSEAALKKLRSSMHRFADEVRAQVEQKA
ncbi:MAG TPA: beta-N-acetylhexosaminidase [Terriglobales bacterium]|nr:beta-N-acetylhexosaminidase [Terriglobales bacterium]